jgi:arginine decarboxylase
MDSNIPTPNAYFLCAASARGAMPLTAFDGALLGSGVGNTNLLKVSSILPPSAREIPPAKLKYGAPVLIAYAAQDSHGATVGQRLSASIAVGVPVDPTLPGVIMEHHTSHGSEEACRTTCEEMVREAFKTRGFELAEVKSKSASIVVPDSGAAAAFAAAVLVHAPE